MRKTLLYIAGVLSFAACEQEVSYDVDYQVLLDGSNTYIAGDPVKFNFTGNADNIVFYSGEPNKEYRNKDRYEVDVREVATADLNLRMQGRYGYDGLEVYISKDFSGLNGEDGGAGSIGENAAADRKIAAGVAEDVNGLKVGETSDGGWRKIFTFWAKKDLSGNDDAWQTIPNQAWGEFACPGIEDFKENFCIAFHYTPEWRNSNQTQRDYWIDGNIDLQLQDIDGEGNPGKLGGKASYQFSQMGWQFVHMHDADFDGNVYPDSYNPDNDADDGAYHPYSTVMENGKVVTVPPYNYCDLNNVNAPLVFVGAPAQEKWTNEGKLPADRQYRADIWAFSKPTKLNRVAPDNGTVIKNMQNYMDSYEYTFEEPGLYEVVFVGINHNYESQSKEVRRLKVNILERIPEI